MCFRVALFLIGAVGFNYEQRKSMQNSPFILLRYILILWELQFRGEPLYESHNITAAQNKRKESGAMPDKTFVEDIACKVWTYLGTMLVIHSIILSASH